MPQTTKGAAHDEDGHSTDDFPSSLATCGGDTSFRYVLLGDTDQGDRGDGDEPNDQQLPEMYKDKVPATSKHDVRPQLKTDDPDNKSTDLSTRGPTRRIIAEDVAEQDVSEENQNNQSPQRRDPGVFVGAFAIPGSYDFMQPPIQRQQVVDTESDIPLIEDAVAVEVNEGALVEAKCIKSIQICGRELQRSTLKLLVCSLLAVAATITITTTAFHFKSRNSASTGHSDCQTRDEYFESLLRTRISQYSSENDLSNPNSPQGQALEWISRESFTYRMRALLEDADDTMLKELYALVVLYYSTDGENWAINKGYMGEKGPCRWNEDLIGCNADTYVVTSVMRINMGKHDDNIQLHNYLMKASVANPKWNFLFDTANNNLHGTVPSEIQHFQNLQELYLNNNPFLSGSIQEELDRLTNLKELNVNNTNVTGSINSRRRDALGPIPLKQGMI